MRKTISTFCLLGLAATGCFAAETTAKTPTPFGTLFPCEWSSYRDPHSGLDIKILTDTASHDSYIYQTDPMWSADQRFILFRSSRRTGGEKPSGQFFLMEAATGRMLQITEGEHGSVFMANRSNDIFINLREDILNRKKRPTGEKSWNLYRMNIDTLWNDALQGQVKAARKYMHLLGSMPLNDSIIGNPGGWCVSSEDDFAYIVAERKGTPEEIAEMEAQAFVPDNGQPIKIKPSLGGIRKMNLRTGEVTVVINTLFKVGHIQSSRFVNDEIVFCNETGGDAHQRMWYVKADGQDFHPIYKETPLDWVTHETFQSRDHVYFNILGFQDRLRKQASGIMRINLRTNDVECIGQVELEGCPFNADPMLGGRGFWHCNSTRDGRLATGDTFAGNVYVINVSNGERHLIATDCRMKPDHAQPHFSPDGRYLLFQSGHFTDGKRLNLMMVDLKQIPSLSKSATQMVDVTSFGAVGDGQTLASPAINAAIEHIAGLGGGTVVVPEGKFSCHSIRLRDGVTLKLSKGAVISAAPANEAGGYDVAEPNEADRYQDFGHSHWHNSLIWGEGLHDVAIVGEGRIEGSKMSRGLSKKGTHEANKAISLRECENVVLDGIEMYECGHFALLATGIKGLKINNLTIDTNRDGLDIDCCHDVEITNCKVNTPWDDAIVLKASYALGRFMNCERITIDGCHVSGYDCGSLLDGTRRLTGATAPDRGGRTGRIKLGTESSGGFNNITIRNCTFDWCRGLALESVDGGHLHDVLVENIEMNHIVNAAIFMRLGSRMRSPEGTPMGTMHNVTLRNIKAYDVDPRYSSIISGVPGHCISDVLLEDIELHYRGGIRLTDKQTNISQAPWERGDYREPKNAEERNDQKKAIEQWNNTERDTALVVNLNQPVPEMETSYPEPWMFGVVPAKGFFIRHAKGIRMKNVKYFFAKEDPRPLFYKEDAEVIEE